MMFFEALRFIPRRRTQAPEDAILLRLIDQQIYLAVTDARALFHTQVSPKGPSPMHGGSKHKPKFTWIEDKPLPLSKLEWDECLKPFMPQAKSVVYQKKRYPRHRLQLAQESLEAWVRGEDLELHPVSYFHSLERRCAACGALNSQSQMQYPNFHCACGVSTTATLNYFSMLWGAKRYEVQLQREAEERPRYRAVG